MALRSAWLLLSLVGRAAAGQGLDTSAMIQVATNVTAADESSAELATDSGSGLHEALGRGLLASAPDLTGSEEFGGNSALAHASMELSKAWTEDVKMLIGDATDLVLSHQEGPLSPVQKHTDSTEAFMELARQTRAGSLSWRDLNWVEKMSEAHAAMSSEIMSKNVDWQSLASGAILLQSASMRISDPEAEAEMMKESIVKAMDIASKKARGNLQEIQNISTQVKHALKQIAVKNFDEMVKNRAKGVKKIMKRGPVKTLDDIITSASNGTVPTATQVSASIQKWINEYIKSGKINYVPLDIMRRMMEHSGKVAGKWVEKGTEWAKQAVGSFLAVGTQAIDDDDVFGPMKVHSAAPIVLDRDVAKHVEETVKRHMQEMSEKQAVLAASQEHPQSMRDELSKNISRGKLNRQSLLTLRTFMDDSAGLAQKWMENTADLQKLISGAFLVMSQNTTSAGRTQMDDLKKDFERVMLMQERIVSKSASDEALLPGGKVLPESLARVKNIADHSIEMVRHWFNKNQDYQRLAAGILEQMEQP